MIQIIVRFNARDNASEKMIGICIERKKTHTRIAVNKRENVR